MTDEYSLESTREKYGADPPDGIESEAAQRQKAMSGNARLDVNSPKDRHNDPLAYLKWTAQNWCKSGCIPMSIIINLIVLVVLLSLVNHATGEPTSDSSAFGNNGDSTCMENCQISLVETTPRGMMYPNGAIVHKSTIRAWMDLIESAQTTIEIATHVFHPNVNQKFFDGINKEELRDFPNALLEAGRDRNVSIKIITSYPPGGQLRAKAQKLINTAKAQVLFFKFDDILEGGGFHTNLWIIDRTHVYVGSANVYWKSLTVRKELGILAINCSCFASDVAKIYEVYLKIINDGKVPTLWPFTVSTKVNIDHPMNFTHNNHNYGGFVASSPKSLLPPGRTSNSEAIVNCIETAKKFIYISVTHYEPVTVQGTKVQYWPDIDNALRSAAIDRKITVRILVSSARRASKSEDSFLSSLAVLNNGYKNVTIEVKKFDRTILPDSHPINQHPLNHNEYMVTDVAGFVGTNNWSGKHSIGNSGIGIVFEDLGDSNVNSIRKQLEDVFNRDWNSIYTRDLQLFSPIVRRRHQHQNQTIPGNRQRQHNRQGIST